MNLYILGNGLDLEMGLKTSYSDFVRSEQFEKLTARNSDCKFPRYILNKISSLDNSDKWVDLEHELKIYVNNIIEIKGSDFKIEFIELKRALLQYLKLNTDIRIPYPDSNATKLAQSVLKDIENNIEVKIVNFNYTDTIVKLIEYGNRKKLDLSTIDYVHPHGSLNENIVLGVEDTAFSSSRKDFVYLKKGMDIHYNHVDWHNAYMKAEKIVIFGHSLGESDSVLFKPFFDYLMSDKLNPKTISIHFLEKDEDYINERLEYYTTGGITYLRSVHKLEKNSK